MQNNCNDSSFCCVPGIDASSVGQATSRNLEQHDDKRIAQDLNSLTGKEREAVYDDIHGVLVPEQQETPEFVNKCVQELQKAFQTHLSKRERAVYQRAIFLRPTLQNDVKFQLMFLRANHYNAKNSARQISHYLENKQRLFGESKMVKQRLTLDDLNEHDIDAMMTAARYPLPQKDRSGRIVWFSDLKQHKTNIDVVHLARYAWYLVMNAVQDDQEAQLRGMVEITNSIDSNSKTRQQMMEFVALYGNCIASLPQRLGAIHYLHNRTYLNPALQIYQTVMGKTGRLRFRAHCGSETESRYVLQQFGIDLPESSCEASPEYRLQVMEEYIEGRKVIESMFHDDNVAGLSDGIDCHYPNPRDVLIGRGHPYQNFAGSRRVLKLVDENLDKYRGESSYRSKSTLAANIVNQIKNEGGRFLQRTENGWVQVDDGKAQTRVNNAFRMRSKTGRNVETTTVVPELDSHGVNLLEGTKRQRT